MKKQVHIHVHDNDWDESKHPRKDNGQFGNGSGSGKKKQETIAAENVGKGIGEHTDKTESAEKRFPKGSTVEIPIYNQQYKIVGYKKGEVTGHAGNTIETTAGCVHVEKARAVSGENRFGAGSVHGKNKANVVSKHTELVAKMKKHNVNIQDPNHPAVKAKVSLEAAAHHYNVAETAHKAGGSEAAVNIHLNKAIQNVKTAKSHLTFIEEEHVFPDEDDEDNEKMDIGFGRKKK